MTKDNAGFSFDDTPPSLSGETTYVKIIAPPAGCKIACRFLGGWRGVWTHWRDPDRGEKGRGQSIPCLGSLERCYSCRRGHRRDWYAYAPVEWWDCPPGREPRWSRAILRLTEAAVLPLADLAILRGVVVEVTRGRGSKSPLTLAVIERSPTHPVPPAFDVGAVLRHMWARWLATNDRADRPPDRPADAEQLRHGDDGQAGDQEPDPAAGLGDWRDGFTGDRG